MRCRAIPGGVGTSVRVREGATRQQHARSVPGPEPALTPAPMSPPLGSLFLTVLVGLSGGSVLLDRAGYFWNTPAHEGAQPQPLRAGLAAGPQPRWAVDPTQPGPNLPPAGRSLFDFTVTRVVDGKPVYD